MGNCVFDKVRSPENPFFKDVKEKWDDLRKDRPKVLKVVESNLKQKKMQAIAVLKSFLQKTSPRADYREVAKLCLILFGEVPPRGIPLN